LFETLANGRASVSVLLLPSSGLDMMNQAIDQL